MYGQHFIHFSTCICVCVCVCVLFLCLVGSVNFVLVSEQEAKTRRHGGQSHRKPRLQTISHPACALEETLPPLKQHT